jgi:hypothetical protein
MVLLSPTSIKTHFCVLLLPVAFCLGEFLFQRRSPILGVVLMVVFIFSTLTVKDLIGAKLGNPIMAAGSITWCSLGLFVATGSVLSAARIRRQKDHAYERTRSPSAIVDLNPHLGSGNAGRMRFLWDRWLTGNEPNEFEPDVSQEEFTTSDKVSSSPTHIETAEHAD